MTHLTAAACVAARPMVVLMLCGVWLWGSPGVLAQEASRAPAVSETRTDAGRMPADIEAAHLFLWTAYPELLGRALTLHTRREGTTVLVSVSEAGARDALAPPLVLARFDYDRDARLRRFDAQGPWVEDARHTALRDAVLSNPKWAESDADVALMRAGGASTVGTTFAPGTAASAVEARMGAARTSGPAQFLWHQDASPGGPPLRVFRMRPVWATDAVAVGPNGEAWTYRFEYEPFDGRLIAVVRR